MAKRKLGLAGRSTCLQDLACTPLTLGQRSVAGGGPRTSTSARVCLLLKLG